MHKFRGDAKIRTWFRTIVVNQSFSLLRSRKQQKSIAIEDAPECLTDFEVKNACSVEGLEQLLIRWQDTDFIRRESEKLPVHVQKVMVLRFFEGKSVEEISQETEKTVPSIKAHLYRGTRLLRMRLEQLY